MRKYIILAVLLISLFIDFVFFDYDISDIRHVKEDTTELVEQLQNSMKIDFPFFFQSSGFHIRNCKDYYKYKPKAINAFEKENLRNLEKYCNLIKLLLHAKVSNNSFVDTVYLTEYNTWDRDLYFKYTCEKIDLDKYKEIMDNNKTVKDLINNKVLDINVINQTEIVVFNRALGKKFYMKEMFRANFDDDKNRDVLVRISQADPTDNYIECNKYIVFSRDSVNELLKEKKVEFRKKIKNKF